MIIIDYKFIKNKLSEQLSESGWDIVDRYLFTDEFQNVLEFLVKEVDNNRRFTPKIKYLFNAFHKCSHDKTKVVIIGQDPYPNLVINNDTGINAADGIAFSCSLTNKEQSSLTKIFDSLENIYPNYNRNTDLSRWAEQGVLLLNSALTTQINKVGTHYNIWKSFITNIIRYINDNMNDIVFIFMGNKAKEFTGLVNKHVTLYCEHPAAAAYKKRTWNNNNIFVEANNKLKKFNKPEIIW